MRFLKGIVVGILVGVLLTGSIAYAASGTEIEVYFKNLKYMIDGVEKIPANGQGFIYKGTTYVPLRFIGESLNKDVNWEGTTQTIWIGRYEDNFTYLSDLDYARKDGEAKYNLYFDKWNVYKFNDTLQIATNEYLHGIGVYLSSWSDKIGSVDYNLNGKYRRLTGYIGIDDNTKNSDATGSVKIIGDGKELMVYRDLKGGDLPLYMDVDISNVLKLQIVFEKDESSKAIALSIGELKVIE